MKSFNAIALSLLAALPYVAAHGFLSEIIMEGERFPGNAPGGNTEPSIIRQISENIPIKGANNPAMNCGLNAQNAAFFAAANPGDEISFAWLARTDLPWVHDTGPMLTYMASCGDVTCDKFDSRNAKWFKIAQVGRRPQGDWFQKELMEGGLDKVRIPEGLAPGNYLIRHEIIALHIGQEQGGAEFYAGCAQLAIGGNGKGVPQANELVSFPGAYSDTDPGILVNAFDSSKEYIFPGPPIAQLAAGSDSSAGKPPAKPVASSPASPAGGAAQPTGTAAASTNNAASSGGSCHLKRADAAPVKRPRHLSRVMRSLNLHRSTSH